MAMPQRDDVIDEIKRTDALLERAVQMGLAGQREGDYAMAAEMERGYGA